MVDGSWVMGYGAWVMVYDLWFMGYGSWVLCCGLPGAASGPSRRASLHAWVPQRYDEVKTCRPVNFTGSKTQPFHESPPSPYHNIWRDTRVTETSASLHGTGARACGPRNKRATAGAPAGGGRGAIKKKNRSNGTVLAGDDGVLLCLALFLRAEQIPHRLIVHLPMAERS